MKDFLISETNHFVVSLSRKSEPGDNSNQRIWYINFDLATLNNLEIIKAVCEKYQDIVYINNAATILPINAVGRFEDDQLPAFYKINVEAPIRIVNALVAQRTGSMTVLNISSGAAKKAICHWSLYCSAKAAVHMFCDVLALDHPEISVENIDPGVIDTSMQNLIRESNFPLLKNFSDLKESGQLKKPIDAAREILLRFV